MLCMLYSQHFLLRTIGLLALQQLSSSEFNDISLGAGEEIELEYQHRKFHGCSSSAASVLLQWSNNHAYRHVRVSWFMGIRRKSPQAEPYLHYSIGSEIN